MDLIIRQDAIDAVLSVIPYDEYWKEQVEIAVNNLPSAEPTLYGYDIESLALVARVMAKEGVSPQKAVQMLSDVKQFYKILDNEMRANAYKAIEKYLSVAPDA